MQVGQKVKRPCLDCPRIGEWKRGRCDQHERARDKARGTTTERGYGSATVTSPLGTATYDATRRAYARRMAAGRAYDCWRCSRPLEGAWTLGHCDIDRSLVHGPECPPCDYATNGRTGCPHPTHA